MIKVLEDFVTVNIPTGQKSAEITFKPKDGLCIGCAVFHNNTDGSKNAGTVRVKIETDSGEVISPLTDIRNYRSREAGYKESMKPLFFETQGKRYVVTILATENFTEDFTADLVLAYQNDYANQNC